MTIVGSNTAHNSRTGVDSLWKEWVATQNVNVRNLIFEHYFPWCRRIALATFRRYGRSSVDWQDCVSTGSLATLQCIERFDPGLGVPFEGYAYPSVRGSILNEISGKDKAPLTTKPGHVIQVFTDQSSSPEADSFERIVDLAIDMAFHCLLDLGSIESLRPDAQYEREETANILAALIERLQGKQKFVVKSYYLQQISMREIANILDVSIPRVSQLHRAGLTNLRRIYESLY